MNKLFTLLLEHPSLANEVAVPCALWGLIGRDDDEAINAVSMAEAKGISAIQASHS